VAVIERSLDEVVRWGAEEMLRRALEEEVEGFLGRGRYERNGDFRGHRNGYAPARQIGTGVGSVAVQAPRVKDVPAAVNPVGFRSTIIPRYQRRTAATGELFARLYLEGLSSGDFEPVFRALLGDDAPLSGSTILRLKSQWEDEYRVWNTRSFTQGRYAYIWCDGIYVGCGQEPDKTVLLCVVGARADGTKELLAMAEGYRESTESWQDVFRSLRERGLTPPLLAIGDGGLGAWAALNEIFPSTRHQRCWNHRALNILDKLPKRLRGEVRKELRAIWDAPTRADAERRRDRYVAELRLQGQEPAAATLLRDWEDFVTFYDFPQEHWIHLRTSNAIESIFSGVRLRTNVAKRMGNRENALYLVFKVVDRLGHTWRALNGGRTLMTLLLTGRRFKDGILVETAAQATAAA
jgi:transposase-like protein